MLIRSFHKNRTIQILSDGKPVTKLEITPKKQVFNIKLPASTGEKRVTVKSLIPCQVPKRLGINKDRRCLAFCIYNSRSVNGNNILSAIHKEYYALGDDPRENNNQYNQQKYKKIIVELRKKLKKYLSSRHTMRNRKAIKVDKKQIEALKALGYIN